MADSKFLYKQIYDKMQENICSGTYAVGDKLPTEEELSKQFHVSSITVKKALGLLADEGVIRRIPGKGTVVIREGVQANTVGSVRLIGLVLEHASTPFGLEMLYRMDRAAEKAGYKLCVRFSYSDREKETEEIAFLISQKVDGLIIMPSRGEHYSTAILRLVVERFPVVLIDKRLEGIPVPSVRTENRMAAALLVQALAEMGCEKMVLITSVENGTTSLEEREKGFYSELAVRDLTLCRQWRIDLFSDVVNNLPEAEVVQTYIRYLEEDRGCFDGIVCLEYGFLPGLLQGMKAIGMRPGQDVQICCFDEDYLAPYGYSFTHVKQDEAAIGEKAVALLLEQIRTGEITEEDCRIPPLFRKVEESKSLVSQGLFPDKLPYTCQG